MMQLEHGGCLGDIKLTGSSVIHQLVLQSTKPRPTCVGDADNMGVKLVTILKLVVPSTM